MPFIKLVWCNATYQTMIDGATSIMMMMLSKTTNREIQTVSGPGFEKKYSILWYDILRRPLDNGKIYYWLLSTRSNYTRSLDFEALALLWKSTPRIKFPLFKPIHASSQKPSKSRLDRWIAKSKHFLYIRHSPNLNLERFHPRLVPVVGIWIWPSLRRRTPSPNQRTVSKMKSREQKSTNCQHLEHCRAETWTNECHDSSSSSTSNTTVNNARVIRSSGNLKITRRSSSSWTPSWNTLPSLSSPSLSKS